MKFIGFKQDPLRPINLSDKKKWRKAKDGTYKLISPDVEKDKQFFSAEVTTKALDKPNEKLWIYGIANANIVDRMQERLDPQGLDILDYMKNRQLLAHHSYYHPIGQVEELEINEGGVHFSAWIGDPARAELTDMQKEIRSLVSQGILRTVSVGFIPKKVRAPLFDDNGAMKEPAVIESWELLELSVVAVPCNQDSVFEMRSSKTSDTINTNSQQDTDDNAADALDDSLTNEGDDVKTKVKAEAEPAPPAEDSKPKDMSEEILTTCRGMYEMVKRQADVMDLILAKLEEDTAQDTGEAPADAPPAEEPSKSISETRLDDIEKTIAGFKSQFDKLTDVVKLLSIRFNK
jgi:HK97 family phage prohead protease